MDEERRMTGQRGSERVVSARVSIRMSDADESGHQRRWRKKGNLTAVPGSVQSDDPGEMGELAAALQLHGHRVRRRKSTLNQPSLLHATLE